MVANSHAGGMGLVEFVFSFESRAHNQDNLFQKYVYSKTGPSRNLKNLEQLEGMTWYIGIR